MQILFFSDFALPDSCAAATRVINLAKLAKDVGHQVTLLGVNYSEDTVLSGSCGDLDYSMIQASGERGIWAYKRIAKLKKTLKTYLEEQPVSFDIIVLSNVYYDYSQLFFQYAKKNKSKLIVNAVEWYDRKNATFSGLTGKYKFVKNRIALRHIHVKMGNILAISSLLDHYYRVRGCNTITIPTIVDMDEYENVTSVPNDTSGVLKIAYAGAPAKKDYIANAIRAIGLLPEKDRRRVQLHLYGPTKHQLLQLGLSEAYLEDVQDQLICHGRIPYGQVKAEIARADFTVLLRPNERYANAGFPTKVGESMACGTPVIANLTSDLHRYIVDGKTGLVCADETPESCADAMHRALELSLEDKLAMRRCALETAGTHFHYAQYAAAFVNFLEKCHAK